jgi:hypothetical protein
MKWDRRRALTRIDMLNRKWRKAHRDAHLMRVMRLDYELFAACGDALHNHGRVYPEGRK